MPKTSTSLPSVYDAKFLLPKFENVQDTKFLTFSFLLFSSFTKLALAGEKFCKKLEVGSGRRLSLPLTMMTSQVTRSHKASYIQFRFDWYTVIFCENKQGLNGAEKPMHRPTQQKFNLVSVQWRVALPISLHGGILYQNFI